MGPIQGRLERHMNIDAQISKSRIFTYRKQVGDLIAFSRGISNIDLSTAILHHPCFTDPSRLTQQFIETHQSKGLLLVIQQQLPEPSCIRESHEQEDG
jgi:hypothetical protein